MTTDLSYMVVIFMFMGNLLCFFVGYFLALHSRKELIASMQKQYDQSREIQDKCMSTILVDKAQTPAETTKVMAYLQGQRKQYASKLAGITAKESKRKEKIPPPNNDKLVTEPLTAPTPGTRSGVTIRMGGV